MNFFNLFQCCGFGKQDIDYEKAIRSNTKKINKTLYHLDTLNCNINLLHTEINLINLQFNKIKLEIKNANKHTNVINSNQTEF